MSLEATNHIRKKVENDESTELSKREAKEQLKYEMRGQMGRVTFEAQTNEELGHETHGDGIVDAKVNGQPVDHYVYHDRP